MQWKDVYKKTLVNFPVLGPIGNISEIFRYFALFETFRTYFSIIHQKLERRLFQKNFKSLHYFFFKLLVRWKDVYKKHLENFPVLGPIGNFSDLQYSVFIKGRKAYA